MGGAPTGITSFDPIQGGQEEKTYFVRQGGHQDVQYSVDGG